MREPLGESLSALFDTEADELDLQRVLNELDKDDEVTRKWQRYTLASASMKSELDQFAGVDLSARVSERLADEEAVVVVPRLERAREWFKPVASIAVAASVTAAILGGTQLYTAAPARPSAAPEALVASGRVGPVSGLGQTVGFGTVPVRSAPDADELDRLNRLADEMARTRLDTYLQGHVEHASLNTSIGMMPIARAASLGDPR